MFRVRKAPCRYYGRVKDGLETIRIATAEQKWIRGKNMAEYIDKHATAEHINMYAKLLTMGDYRSGMMKAKEILLNQESVDIDPSIPKIIRGTDIVPVVRCKDCKFYTSMRPDIKTGICDLNVHHMGDDGFCSCGEGGINGK